MSEGALITPTRGESLLLWRRRADLGQVAAAKLFEVSHDIYWQWETDRRTEGQPRKHLGQLKMHEVCFLLRRRAKVSQRKLAELMGITRLWVIQMEAGTAPVERLRNHWKV